MHEPEIPFLDEIQQGQPRRLILLRDRHHQAQVRLHERFLGTRPLTLDAHQAEALRGADVGGVSVGTALEGFLGGEALLDLLGKPDFVVLGEQGILADVGQVQPDEIFLVTFDPLFGHPATSLVVSLL